MKALHKPTTWWALFLVVIVARGTTALLAPINHDVATLLSYAQRCVAGATMYRDIVDINPPAILWYNISMESLDTIPMEPLDTILMEPLDTILMEPLENIPVEPFDTMPQIHDTLPCRCGLAPSSCIFISTKLLAPSLLRIDFGRNQIDGRAAIGPLQQSTRRMMYYSSSSPLPPLRNDITGYELVAGVVVLYDDTRYSDKIARLPSEIIEYLMLMDGTRTAQFLAEHSARVGRSFSVEQFLEVVNVLEHEYFLDSTRFREHKAAIDKAFNESPTRPAAHAGASYPDDPEELRKMLDGFLADGKANGNGTSNGAPRDMHEKKPIAVIAPHIDFRVGGSSYGPAYNALRRSDADTFVIFGVSHQMSYDSFMISTKDFETPLGPVQNDREFIEHFRSLLGFELTRDEIAHRQEHSIEFQAVFLRHIFPDRDIKIVPILAGSLHHYVEMGDGNAGEDERLTRLYDALEETARDLGRKVCYVAGADLCHVGPKFGDDFPAKDILAELRERDMQTLASAAQPDADAFLKSIASINNRYRICGVAPIYATLRAARPTAGEILCYDQWDETERESAVTFGCVALYR